LYVKALKTSVQKFFSEGHVLYKLVLHVNQCTAISSRNSQCSTQTRLYERGPLTEPRGNLIRYKKRYWAIKKDGRICRYRPSYGTSEGNVMNSLVGEREKVFVDGFVEINSWPV
jgi:hypothetical protein